MPMALHNLLLLRLPKCSLEVRGQRKRARITSILCTGARPSPLTPPPPPPRRVFYLFLAKASFCSRFHFLISASRLRALLLVRYFSKYKIFTGLWLRV